MSLPVTKQQQQPVIGLGGGLSQQIISAEPVNQPSAGTAPQQVQQQSQPVQLSTGVYPTPAVSQSPQPTPAVEGAPPELINANERQQQSQQQQQTQQPVLSTGGGPSQEVVAVEMKPSLASSVWNAVVNNPIATAFNELAQGAYNIVAYPVQTRYFTTPSGTRLSEGGGRGYQGMYRGQMVEHTSGQNIYGLHESYEQGLASFATDLANYNAQVAQYNQQVAGLNNALKLDPHDQTLQKAAQNLQAEGESLQRQGQVLQQRRENLQNMASELSTYERENAIPLAIGTGITGLLVGFGSAVIPATWPQGIVSLYETVKNPGATWSSITASPESAAFFGGEVAGGLLAMKVPLRTSASKLTLEEIRVGPEEGEGGLLSFRLQEPERLALRATVSRQKIASWQVPELIEYTRSAEQNAYGLRVVTEGGEARTLEGIPVSSSDFAKLFKGESVPIRSPEYRYYFMEENVARPKFIEETTLETNYLAPVKEGEVLEKTETGWLVDTGVKAEYREMVPVTRTIENPYTDYGIGLSEAKEQMPTEETTLNPGKLTSYRKEPFSFQSFKARVLGYELGKEEPVKMFGKQGMGKKLPFFDISDLGIEKGKASMIRDLEESMKPEDWQAEYEAKQFETGVQRLAEGKRARSFGVDEETPGRSAGKTEEGGTVREITTGRGRQQTVLLTKEAEAVSTKPVVRIEYRTKPSLIPAVRVRSKHRQKQPTISLVSPVSGVATKSTLKQTGVSKQGRVQKQRQAFQFESIASPAQALMSLPRMMPPTPPSPPKSVPPIVPYWLPTAVPAKRGRRGTKYWEELYELYNLKKMFGR
ncbi:MAG: hypothetical protein JRN68_05705 [Nitrososphaerota archaeon]|nr:hypothetical protein [Nitrososphaerota archaeon]